MSVSFTCPSSAHSWSVVAVDHSYFCKYLEIPSKNGSLPIISCNIRRMDAPYDQKMEKGNDYMVYKVLL